MFKYVQLFIFQLSGTCVTVSHYHGICLTKFLKEKKTTLEHVRISGDISLWISWDISLKKSSPVTKVFSND